MRTISYKIKTGKIKQNSQKFGKSSKLKFPPVQLTRLLTEWARIFLVNTRSCFFNRTLTNCFSCAARPRLSSFWAQGQTKTFTHTPVCWTVTVSPKVSFGSFWYWVPPVVIDPSFSNIWSRVHDAAWQWNRSCFMFLHLRGSPAHYTLIWSFKKGKKRIDSGNRASFYIQFTLWFMWFSSIIVGRPSKRNIPTQLQQLRSLF